MEVAAKWAAPVTRVHPQLIETSLAFVRRRGSRSNRKPCIHGAFLRKTPRCSYLRVNTDLLLINHNLTLLHPIHLKMTNLLQRLVSAMTSFQPRLFLEIVREYMTKDAIENSLTEKTKEKHEFMYNNLTRFMQEARLTLKADEVRMKHMEAFKIWLMTQTKARSPEHISRRLRLCKNALDHAVNQEYIDANRLKSIKLKKGPQKQVISLELSELERIKAFEPDLLHEALTQDLFLFQCYTGLRFMDLWLFQVKDEKVAGNKKITFITCSKGRGKTQKEYWTELAPEARIILKKYKGKFPKIHNQSYNRTIRKIVMLCGISKHVTTHTARKTFATLKRAKGYSIPAIADMLGNTEMVARKHYVNRSKELVISEILKNEPKHFDN